MRKLFRKFIFFFPFSLVVIHFKRNHLLLFFWLLLFAIVGQKIGTQYGVHNLFLAPEYLGEINYISYSIIGFMVGCLIVAFNIYSYQLNILLFPFMATVAKPFIKYTYNNSIIPLSFIFYYLYASSKFQYEEELIPTTEIVLNLIGFLSGILFFIIIAYIYFLRFDKNIYKISGLSEEELSAYKTSYDKSFDGLNISKILTKRYQRIRPWRIESYLSKPFKIGLARSSEHYNHLLIKLFFTKNHVNASLFEIGVIITFISIGLFRESPIFMIPAGASILLLFSLILMLVSTFYSFFKRWSLSIIIILAITINLLTTKTQLFHFKSFAYGLNYNTTKADYSENNLYDLAYNEKNYWEDLTNSKSILAKWKRKTKKSKPKLILLNTSGGGLRSALWTFSTLQYLDSLFDGDVSKQMHLITGASGGMIGAAYYRELCLLSQTDSSINPLDKKYRDYLSKDILNPISFNLTTADFLPRFQQYNNGKYIYTKDRGYVFEDVLNKNTKGVLDKRLSDYKEDELKANIPLMIFSPTIANENRRLLISSQPISFLSYIGNPAEIGYNPTVENVEYTRLFEEQDPYNLQLTSAIRMSATFPYILPMAHLPSTPQIKVLDAGARDNIGSKLSYKYIFELREWIKYNTSGVIIITIRDKPNTVNKKKSLSRANTSITTPISVPYNNFFGVQDFVNDESYRFIAPYFNNKIHQVIFSLNPQKNVSLSLHLSEKEKAKVLQELNEENNKKSIETLKKLLK